MKIRELATYTKSGAEVAWMKNTWAEMTNQALKDAGLEARVHVGRRLDRAPVPTLTPQTAGPERRRRRKRRDEYLDLVDGDRARADAMAANDLREPLRAQLGEDAEDEDRARLRLRGLGQMSDPVATQQISTLGSQTARHAGELAAQERRDGTTATARYAPKARSRLGGWRQTKAKKAEPISARPRRPGTAKQPETETRERRWRTKADRQAQPTPPPPRSAPEPEHEIQPAKPPRPTRKRRLRTRPDRQAQPTPPPPRSAPEPEREIQPAKPPRPTRKRRLRTRPDGQARPTAPRQSTLESDLRSGIEPLGECALRWAAGDEAGAKSAGRRFAKDAPSLARDPIARSAAADGATDAARRRGISVSRSSSAHQVDRACDAWRAAIRTDVGTLIADMLVAMLDALEQKAEAKRKAAQKPGPKRSLPLPERNRRREAHDHLKSAITPRTVAAAGNAWLRQHAGDPDAPSPVTVLRHADLGPQTARATVDALAAHVEPHQVRPKHRLGGRAASLGPLRRALRAWRAAITEPGRAHAIARALTETVWPTHWDETEAARQRRERERKAKEQAERRQQQHEPATVATPERTTHTPDGPGIGC